jgi:probable phosphoglycerate mutase
VGRILARIHPDAAELGVWCSPLGRCRNTLHLARESYAESGGRNLRDEALADDLLEVTFGDLEGHTLAELPAELAAARKADPWNFRVPGGESYADGAERAQIWLEQRSGPLLIVSHGGICRGMRKILLGLDEYEAGLFRTPQGVVIEWERTPEGRWDEAFHELA